MDSIHYLHRRRIGLNLNSGTTPPTLEAWPRHRLTLELKAFIRDHRDALIAAMQAAITSGALDVTVGNMLALDDAQFEELRAEIAATTDDDPFAGHDRAAFALADQRRLRRKEAA